MSARKTPAPENAQDKAKEQTGEDQRPVNAVIVIKQVAEDGSITTAVQSVGDVQATEVQTLLELGVASWRQQIGLSGQPGR